MKIIVSGGGTMGHIKPAMIVSDELLKNNEVIFFGNKNSKEKKEADKREKLDYVEIDVLGFNHNIFRNIKAIIKLFFAYKYCLKKLKHIKPDRVIGFGGYVSAPVLLAAKKLKIKSYIHEQNSIPGKVNKYLSKYVSNSFISFPNTDNYLKNTIFTGNPVNKIIYKPTNLIKKGTKTILFIGGSLGAKTINEEALKLKNKYNIILISGEKYYEEIDKKGIKVIKYFEDLPSLMVESDLIVSRSGATTISEILAIGKPVIFIPSPNVSNNHQLYNASFLYDNKACFMVEEKNITILEEKIDILLNNNFIREEMILNQRKLNKVDSLKKIIQIINS